MTDRFVTPENLLDNINPSKAADKTLDESKAFRIGIDKFVTVDKYNFEPRVKIGQYYKNHNQQWVYGGKGLVFSEDEWIQLLKSAGAINTMALSLCNKK